MSQDHRKSTRTKSKSSSKIVASTDLRSMMKDAMSKQPPFPAEGMARCVSNDELDADLNVGDVVYMREIPNMCGHCVVLRNGKMPLVGYHLDRFKLLGEEEL